MLVEREEVNRLLSRWIDPFLFNADNSSKVCAAANEQFGIPTGDIMDFITGRTLPEDADELQLFALIYAIDKVNGTNHLRKIYSDEEIVDFENEHYEPVVVKFPIRISCVQVAPDQWIGTCDVKFLMKLYYSQLIRYNENAQRALKRRIRGGIETWTIDINKTAVDQIMRLLNTNTYIPNVITLNIPEDANVEMNYDVSKKELVIRSIDRFDIADGYHRLVSMSRLYQKDKTFNYGMELRITQFENDKVKRFIFQEDQKTKMNKVTSDSYNLSDTANMITESINSDSRFYLNNQISRNNGKINFGEFAKCVQYFYGTDKIPLNKRGQFIINTKKIIIERINNIIENCNELMSEDHISYMELMIIFSVITWTDDFNDMADYINVGMKNKDKFDKKKFYMRRPRKGLVSEIRKVIKENV